MIGVFNVAKTIGGATEKRIKLVRDVFRDDEGNILEMSWDSSADGSNEGYGINQCGASGNYEGADLMRMLNGYCLGTTNTCTYCSSWKQSTCSNECTSNITPLSTSSKNMIDQAVWSTRGVGYQSYIAKEMYEAEQTSELTGKICT